MEQTAPQSSRITCDYTLRRGNPPDEILGVAKQKQVEMIVMGTHGQTNSPKVPVGRITAIILEQAECPVISLKRPSSLMVAD